MTTTPEETGLQRPAGPARAETMVPHNHLMVGLLGQRDELLRLIEDAFPTTRVTVAAT